MQPGTIWILSIVLMTAATPVVAHHSHANYWETEWINLEGTVQEVHWMNPHSWIYLKVTDADGKPGAWALEGASITTLRRDGWTQESVQVGATLSVRCHPLKDRSRGCLLGFIKMSDGSEREFD